MSDGNGKKEKKQGSSAFLISDEAKEIKVEHGGEIGVFKYRGIGAFEHNRLLEQHGKYDPATGQVSLNLADYIHNFLKAVLVEAPFELTDANLKRLHPMVATKLVNEIGVGIKIADVGDHSCA